MPPDKKIDLDLALLSARQLRDLLPCIVPKDRLDLYRLWLAVTRQECALIDDYFDTVLDQDDEARKKYEREQQVEQVLQDFLATFE